MNSPLLSFRPDLGDVHVDLERLVASRLLVQANSGGGKSRLIRYMVEQLHGRVQIVVLDPEGEFATLRERHDFLLAGADGDVAADPKTAKLLARRLLELNASAIVDLYDLKLQARRSYVRLFLDELVHAPRKLWRPLLIVIDEAHAFAPQVGDAESLAAVIDLCTLGRKRGFAAVLATQRISKLHKDAAAELHNKLIGRTGLDVDMKRAGDELGLDKEGRIKLRELKPGSFYAFGPAVDASGVTLVRSGEVRTTHPQPGEIAPPSPPPPAAVRRLLAQMQDLEREAADELRTIEDRDREIAKLKTELRRAERARPAAEPVVDERAVARAIAQAEKPLRDEIASLRGAAERRERELVRWIGRIQTDAARLVGLIEGAPGAARSQPVAAPAATTARAETRSTPPEPPPRANTTRPRTPEPSAPEAPEACLSRPQLRVLETLAALQGIGLYAPDRSTVAVFSDQSPRSSGYANNLGALRSAGLIDYPTGGCVSITDDGMLCVGEVPEIGSLVELHEAWFARVSAPQRRILEELISIYPDSIDRVVLAERTAQSAASSGYANNLGFLRNSLGLIDYPASGTVAATPRLFPEGL